MRRSSSLRARKQTRRHKEPIKEIERMTIKPAERHRAARNKRIVALARRNAEKYATQLELYIAIAEAVGCSHITVYRVLKEAGE